MEKTTTTKCAAKFSSPPTHSDDHSTNRVYASVSPCPNVEPHGDMVSGPSCHKCKRPGHIARDCRSGGPPSFGGDQGPRRRNKEKCYKCNQFGHFARECKEEGDRCYRCKGE